MKKILLVGNPNAGKTSLFNALVGANQRVGNWPGVTVEKKTGYIQTGSNQKIEITDLPGLYSLTNTGLSLDEQIAATIILESEADVIINVVDACHLERHLFLTSQLIELGKPLIIAVNMMDIAKTRGIDIDISSLAKELQCTVLAIQAHRQIGIDNLKEAIQKRQMRASFKLELVDYLEPIYQQIKESYRNTVEPRLASYYAYRALEGDLSLPFRESFNSLLVDLGSDYDIAAVDARYQKIHQIVKQVQKRQKDRRENFTAKLDKIVLNRFLALPLFLSLMYLMFFFAINIGGAFQDFFDITTDAIFVEGAAHLLQTINTPNWLIALIANGLGKGINTTLTFIPVIAAMFFFLALLETSGYMARAAFVIDRLMRALGLPGKAFVPMIVGFGCNVPAIMSARTLESERERILTILMSPFMSCSARLAIYAIFVAAFFPTNGQNIIFALYLIGILMAVLTGYLLRKTLFQGEVSPLILELPAYHKPLFSRLCRETMLRLKHFIIRAGCLIIPVCVVLGSLNAFTLNGGITTSIASHESILAYLGKLITPFFAPMGLTEANWPATVGLLTGTLAKEVVVSSLNCLYGQIGGLAEPSLNHFDLIGSLKIALWTIPDNLFHLNDALLNPLADSSEEFNQSVYGMMVNRFDGKAGAFSYLLFILLYIPCVSTMAVIRTETSKRLMWFSIAWSLLVAYSASTLFYQMATFVNHPLQSLLWVAFFSILISLTVRALHHKTFWVRRLAC